MIETNRLRIYAATQNEMAEIGYGILEKYQGQGYATEAVKAVTDWAFQDGSITSIEAETEDDNEASQKVLAKCGFVGVYAKTSLCTILSTLFKRIYMQNSLKLLF